MDGTHLIDGCMKNPHINALDVRVHNATLFGDGVYITDGLDGLPIKVVNANTLSVGRGCMLVNGARITQEKLLNLTIESGQQNLNRNDLLVGTYTYDGANTRYEDVNFEIITGTPTSGTAADPTIHEGSLLDINNAALVSGVSTVQFPIARIPIKGISVGEPVILAKKFQSVAGLGDSVSQSEAKQLSIGITYERYGQLVIVNIYNVTYSGNTRRFGPMPAGLRPRSTRYGVVNSAANAGIVYVDASGNIEVWAGANGTYTGQVVYTV